jgi:S-(hydroxymethyl)glutathione dehydrogenase / alcohol dehydrogenase
MVCGAKEGIDMAPQSRVSRRRVLKSAGAAAVGTGAAALLGSPIAAQGQAPAILTNAQGGRRFRALVKYTNQLPEVVELTARPLTGRQIVVRTQAAQTCYSSVDQVLVPGTPPPPDATIVGHGGVGIVEAVGPQAYHVQVGDKVIVNFHTSCGSCFNCLWMRSDKCLSRGAAIAVPVANLGNIPVYPGNNGMTELMIVHEEQAVPLFTDIAPVEIAMLHCVGNCGIGMTMTNCPVEAGSDVVIFGAGPVGLSSVQGARIKGASQIIVVEPVPYRRDLARNLGATAVVDPNDFKERQRIVSPAGNITFRDALVDRLREMTKKKTDRLFAGGGTIGPDHIIEAVGGDRLTPKTPQGPDPTGVTVLQQCWDLCSQIGTIATCSIGQPAAAMVQIPAAQWADGAKHHWPGTAGGTNPRRDVPRYVRMMETGQLNMKVLASKTYPLSQARQAYQEAADRTVVATIVTPTST